MKNNYVLTGFDKTHDKLSTNMYDDIEVVYTIIDTYSHDELEKKYKGNINDFAFDVSSRRSHNGAVIISDNSFKWSVFQIQR